MCARKTGQSNENGKNPKLPDPHERQLAKDLKSSRERQKRERRGKGTITYEKRALRHGKFYSSPKGSSGRGNGKPYLDPLPGGQCRRTGEKKENAWEKIFFIEKDRRPE